MEPCDNTNNQRMLSKSSSSGATGGVGDGNYSAESWHPRYIQAVRRYEQLDLYSPEAFWAIAEGLMEWADSLPLRSWRRTGRPAPANKWGMGVERCMIRSLNSCLVERGDNELAARVNSEMADLLETVESLDFCCMDSTADVNTEERLAGTARLQARSLAKLLQRIATRDKPKKKRKAVKVGKSIPSTGTSWQDRKLMEQWEQVRGAGGMTRKEFCAMKGIEMIDFVRTQDRHRKRLAAES